MKVTAANLIAFLLILNLLTLSGANAKTGPAISNATRAVFPSTALQGDQASTALHEGRRLLKRGKTAEALVQLQNALSLYTAAKNSSGMAAAHNELGDLYLRQGQYNVALDHYKSAFEGFVGASKNQQAVGSALGAADSRLANANVELADDKFNANLMLAKIGDVNFRLGKLSDASAAYSQMEVKQPESAAAKTTRRFGGLAGVLSTMSTGKPSVEAPASGVTTLLEVKKEIDEYRVGIIFSSHELGLGRIAYFNNDLESAKTHFQKALDATSSSIAGLAKLGQTRRFRAAARTSLADVAFKQGNIKDAQKLYAAAVKGAQDDKRLDLIWPAQRGLGRSLWLQAAGEKDAKKGNSLRESALNNYRESIKTIETLRQGSLRADEARTTFLSTTKDVFDEASVAFAEMALLSAGGAAGSVTMKEGLEGKALEYAGEAFKISEESRARSLLDLLSETNTPITEGVPTELLKRKQENLDRQQEIAEQLTGISLASDQQKQKPSESDAELEKLQTEYDDIENQIRTASPRYAALTAAQPLSVSEVQQKVLDDQTVLLEYSLAKDASYLWAISPNSVALYKLASKNDLDKLATDLRAQLIPSKLQRRIVGIDVAADAQRGLGVAIGPSAEEAAGFIAASNALYKAALEPAAAIVGEKRLLVVADGALNYIPFEALVKTAGSGDYSALSYLIKSNEIIYAPSASVIGAIRQQGNKRTGNAMLIVADPVFNSNDTRARGASSSAELAQTRGLGIASALSDVAGQNVTSPATANMQGLPLARLAGTRVEAEQIKNLAKTAGATAETWLDLDASEANLDSRDITKYSVVHIATHGLLDAERPQFTGIVLSLVGNKNDDGFLRTDEVFNLRLGSPLVMLSACETGLGKERRGEGVMGLTRAFMYAGAPTVGVTLWSVADKSTADLMTDFYKRLLSSARAQSASATGPSTAIRDAQLAMISGKKYSAPFYWAPFVLVGDWR